jgi:hypothetical protein
VLLAAALLTASAGLRLWQQSRVAEALRAGTVSPFPLAELPLVLGSWQGQEDTLDPQIARATGSVDRIFRTYHDTRTGVRVSVIVLYGPPVDMAIHSPENCYRAAGYSQTDTARIRPVRLGRGTATAPFRALTFTRGDGGRRDRQHVYYAWRYDGRYAPDMPLQKQLERIAGTYKIHVARAAADAERFDLIETGDDAAPQLLRDPCQDFLDLLVPELEQRVAARDPGAADG